ncbi:MAG: SDR family oxidoreductase [Euryarchaeota archaeon]|nr:SDR family oxidoreductase [Euryarchaeota archaeon]
MDLKSKTVLITGGTGDFGRRVTEAFLRARARVVATYISDHELQAVRALWRRLPNRPTFVRTDVTDEARVKALVQQVLRDHRRVDILVNLVGGFIGGPPVSETSLEDFDLALKLNLRSTFIVSRAVAPVMARQGRGRIINISSRSGLRGHAGAAAHAAAKGGVIRLTEAMADELRDHGVTVNAVVHAPIDTPTNRRMMPDETHWVKAEEVAAAILFLAGDEAGSITGAAIPILGRA